MSSDGIFNTTIGYGSAFIGSFPVIGPIWSEYQLLYPTGYARAIDSYGYLHRHVIQGQLFSSRSDQSGSALHRHITVGFTTAAIGSCTTAITALAAVALKQIPPLYGLPIAAALALNSVRCGLRARELYADANRFGY